MVAPAAAAIGFNPATIGAVGSLLGGLGSAFGGKSEGLSPEAAMLAQSYMGIKHDHDNLHSQFNLKMNLAKQHGLHPLSVLGVPFSGGSMPAVVSGGDSGPDYSDLGNAVANVSRSFVKPPEESPDPYAERMAQASVRMAEANANRAEWEALRSQWNAQDIIRGQPGNPPAVHTSNDVVGTRALAAAQAGVSPGMFSGGTVNLEQSVTPPHPRILGHAAGADQSFQRMVDKDGFLYSTPNPNVYNPDIEHFGTFHFLSNRYGADKALNIMAALEQAPVAGGILGALGAGAYAVKRYFGQQRIDAERRMKQNRAGQAWRGRSTRFGRGSD